VYVWERRRRNVKEDKFLVKFKRLLINGEQYITNAEKFGNQECWKFEEKEKTLKGKTFFFYLT
jgi:hypothetical protein